MTSDLTQKDVPITDRSFRHLTFSQTSSGFYVQYKSLENTVGKGEIAHDEQYLLFPHLFFPIFRTFCHFYQIWSFRLQTLWVCKSLKFVVWERVKNLLYNSDFKSAWENMDNWKHCEKRRKC